MSSLDKDMNFNKETFVICTPGNMTDHYVKVKLLGTGSFGKVFEVKNKITNNVYACKELAKRKIKSIEKFNTEITIMKKCDHPNIIKLYEIYEDDRHIDLIMEECLGGELFDRIIEHIDKKQMYSEKEAANIFKQLMSAIAYCHSQGICHRDLKPENILFLNKDENSPIKIIDFGLSKIFGEYNNIKNNQMSTKVGTAYYVSPEVLQGKYDEKCDIWSAGVILYILLSGNPPFNGANDNEIYKKISLKKFDFPPKYFDNISNEAKDLISKMLCEPEQRLTAQEVLNHEWLLKNAPNSKGNLENLNIQHLKNYSSTNKLKKAILTFIASRLQEYEVENLRKNFEEIDLNKDGTITLDEMKNCMNKFCGDKNVEELFKSFDTDGTGKLGYTEFISASIEQNIYMREERLLEAFKMLDKDNNGKISKEEIKNALKLDNIDNNQLSIYIQKFDLNGDGEIDYYEFLHMMSNK